MRRSTFSSVLHSADARAVAYQVAVAAAIAGILYFLVTSTIANLNRQGIASGFDFLDYQAGYVVGESFIPHTGEITYGQIFLIGLLNTLYISALAIVFSTIFGILVGFGRLSSNWLIARLAGAFIELFRNVPLLLQIVFWYTLLRQLPAPRQALEPVAGVFLSNRGLVIPALVWNPQHVWIGAALLLSILVAVALWRHAGERGHPGGRPAVTVLCTLVLAAGLPLLAWQLAGALPAFDVPSLQGFNFRGGTTFSPEFLGLLTALVVYNAAFVGEIVRSGIQAVSTGQVEAAQSIGLRQRQVMQYVVLPQTLRVVVPPMTNQYLNVVKDSSLAVWIGYPDLVAVTTTAINLTGQVVEPLFIIMCVYLSISITISLFMNWYNRKIALRGS